MFDKCEACNDKGYLEVTHQDSCEYIEACEECNGFGVMMNYTEATYKARVSALKHGYKLSINGKILVG